MTEKPRPLSDLFDNFRSDQELQYEREQTPGTVEHARAQAQTAAFEGRVADKVAAVVAAGGILGVTHTEQGEPLADEVDEDDDSVLSEDGEPVSDEDVAEPVCAFCFQPMSSPATGRCLQPHLHET